MKPETETSPSDGERPDFHRALSRFDATMVVVGGIIGAGIFINPYIVAQRLDTGPLVLAAWAAGGFVALAGALVFAELGTLFPQAGGHYVYLRKAFHPMAGFLYGWALLLMIESGAIAAVGITFAEYTLRFLGRDGVGAVPLAVIAIAVVALINYLGVKPGSRVLNVFVVLKVAALVALIAAGLFLPGSEDSAVSAVGGGAAVGVEAGAAGIDAATAGAENATAGGPVGAGAVTAGAEGASAGGPGGLTIFVFAFGAALIPVMFSYGGWQNANYVAEEMKRPKRDLPVSLLVGTATVVVVYLLVNLVYLKALGHGGLAGTMTPASDTAGLVFGAWGDRFIALAISISTFGFLNLTMLAPTRVYYAMARDGVFLEAVSRLHPRFRTPSLSIGIQAGWAILLALTGTFAQLVDYVVFADWIFFGLAGASLFVFRRTLPAVQRSQDSFLTPGYPIIPAIFVGVSLLIVISVVWTNPVRSGLGALLLATGVPAFLYWQRKR